MKDNNGKETLIEVALERLSNDIICGVLPPEKKLLIADLKDRYAMGASPLREALAQLSTLGFVVFDSRRGFRVTSISKEDLDDITALRKIIETAALQQAIMYGDDEWELGIVTAYARLERIVKKIEEQGESDSRLLGEYHKQFHAALIVACRSSRLLNIQSILYNQARRYRHLMLTKIHNLKEFISIHEELMKAVLSRQAERACALLSTHIELTPQNVYPESTNQ